MSEARRPNGTAMALSASCDDRSRTPAARRGHIHVTCLPTSRKRTCIPKGSHLSWRSRKHVVFFQGRHQKATFIWRKPAPTTKSAPARLRRAHDQTTKDSRMVSRNLPHEYFFLNGARSDGPVIGHIDGTPIPARVVDTRGSRYRFVGIARRDRRGRLDVTALRKNEWLVKPDLIYAAAA